MNTHLQHILVGQEFYFPRYRAVCVRVLTQFLTKEYALDEKINLIPCLPIGTDIVVYGNKLDVVEVLDYAQKRLGSE